MLLSKCSIVTSAFVLLSLLSQAGVLAEAGGQTITARILANSNSSSTTQCESEGLSGECNDSICCCYKGGGGFVKITPNGDSCKRSFGGSQVWVAIVLAAIVVVVTLAASCYFNGRLCISPYKPAAHQITRTSGGLQ